MAATFTVTLTSGMTSVQLPGPESGTQVRGPAHWVTGQTVDGTRFSYQTSNSTKRLWTIRLVTLSAAQKAALESFFYSTVGGPTVAFTYTHTDGTSYTARFVQPGLEFLRRNSTQWDVVLTLETDGVVS